ncbi:TPA: DUF3265 domain-containing protein [Vibrio vulnificus]|nr:DUF3265 domain-containing protein [Vibrio vulnificus]
MNPSALTNALRRIRNAWRLWFTVNLVFRYYAEASYCVAHHLSGR